MVDSERLLYRCCLTAVAVTPVIFDPLAAEPLGAVKWLVPGCAAILIALVLAWRGRIPAVLDTAPGKALLACLGAALVSSFGAITHGFAIDELIRLTGLAVIVIGVSEVDWNPTRRRWLVAALVAPALVNGWLAVCEYYAFDWWPWKFTQHNRLVALFGHQNTLAQFLIQPLLMLAVLFLSGGRRLVAIPLLLLQGVVILTLCRGAWVAQIAGLACVLWMFRTRVRNGRRLAGLILAVVLLAWITHFGWDAKEVPDAPFTYKQDAKILTQDSNRLTFIRQSTAAILERPLFGAGPGNFPVAYQQVDEVRADYRRFAHIDVLHWGVETGLVGLAALAWLCVTVWRRLPSASPEIVAALVGTFVHALVSYNFYMPAPATAAAVLLGVVLHGSGQPRPIRARPVLLLPVLVLVAGVFPRLTAEARVSRLEKQAYLLLRGKPENADDFRERTGRAIDYLGQALDLRPHDHQVLQRSAGMHLRLGNLHEARLQVESLQRLTPYNDNVHLMAAHIHAMRNDHDARIASLEQALEVAVNRRTIEDELWILYHSPGDRYRERLARLEERFASENDWPQHREQLGRRLAAVSGAAPLFLEEMRLQQQLEREGEDPTLLARLGSLHYQLGRYRASLEAYRSAINLMERGSAVNEEDLADLLMGAGNVHVHNKLETEGFRLFRLGRERFPDDVRFFEPFFRRTLYDAGWQTALKELDTALESTDSNRFRHRAAVALAEHARGDKVQLLEGLALLNKQCEETGTGRDFFERARYHHVFFQDHRSEALRDYRLAIDVKIPEYETYCLEMIAKLEAD